MNIHDMTFQEAHHGGSQWLCIQTSLQTVGLCGNPPGNLDVFELEL